MHLTGIKDYSPSVFFNKCVSLSLNEFDIGKITSKDKGNIHRKMQSLQKMDVFLIME